MPDINLIEDTKTPNDGSSMKKTPPAPLRYSSVEEVTKGDHPLMKPSGPMLWLKSLFSRRPKGKPAERPKPSPTPPKIGEIKKDPKDIFGELDMPETVMMTRRAPAEPRMPAPAASRIVQTPAGSSLNGPTVPHPAPVVLSRPQPAIEGSPLRMPNVLPAAPQIQATRANIPAAPLPRPASIPPLQGQKKVPKDLGKKKGKRSEDEVEEFEGVNLLPEELVSTFNPKKKLTTVGLVALAAVLLVGIVDVSLLLWKETQVKKTNEKTAEVNQVISRIKGLEADQRLAIAYKAQNDVLRQLLNRHVYWTQFLNKFQQYTLPSVYYPGGISLDLGGVSSMTGSAPDLETVLNQLAIYQNAPDLVQSASIDTITRNATGDTYSFVIDFMFNPAVFYRPLDIPATTTK